MTESVWYSCNHCKAKYRNNDLAEQCCGLPNSWGEPA